jgi:hypothetical protein
MLREEGLASGGCENACSTRSNPAWPSDGPDMQTIVGLVWAARFLGNNGTYTGTIQSAYTRDVWDVCL